MLGAKQNFCLKILYVKEDFCSNILDAKEHFYLNMLGAKQDSCSNILDVSKTFVQKCRVQSKI